MNEVKPNGLKKYKKGGEFHIAGVIEYQDDNGDVIDTNLNLEDRRFSESLFSEMQKDGLLIAESEESIRDEFDQIISRNIPTVLVMLDISYPYNEVTDRATLGYLKNEMLKQINKLQKEGINVKLVDASSGNEKIIEKLLSDYGVSGTIPDMDKKQPMMIPLMPSINEEDKLDIVWKGLARRSQNDKQFSKSSDFIDAVIGMIGEPKETDIGIDDIPELSVSTEKAIQLAKQVGKPGSRKKVGDMVFLDDAAQPTFEYPDGTQEKQGILIHKSATNDENLLKIGARDSNFAYSITTTGLIVQNFDPKLGAGAGGPAAMVGGNLWTNPGFVGVEFSNISGNGPLTWQQVVAFRKLEAHLEKSFDRELVTHTSYQVVQQENGDKMSDITFNDNGGNPKSRNEDGANREKYKYTPHIYFKEITNKEIVLLGVEPISRYGIGENYIFSRKNIDDTIKQAKEKVVFLTETLKLVERGSKQFIGLNASINYMITDILLPSIMGRIIRDAFDNDDRSILLELVSTGTMSRDFQDNRATRDSIPPDKKERLTILRNTLPKNVNGEVIMDRNFNQMVNPLIKEIFKGMGSGVALNHQLGFNQDDGVNTDKGALTDLRIIDTYMVMNIR